MKLVHPACAIAGSFAQAGKVDLTTGDNGGNLNVFLGKGDGTFLAPITYNQARAMNLGIGDLDADGKLDVVVDGPGILLGQGDGSFKAGPPLKAMYGGMAVMGDFNGDKRLDVMSLHGSESG